MRKSGLILTAKQDAETFLRVRATLATRIYKQIKEGNRSNFYAEQYGS